MRSTTRCSSIGQEGRRGRVAAQAHLGQLVEVHALDEARVDLAHELEHLSGGHDQHRLAARARAADEIAAAARVLRRDLQAAAARQEVRDRDRHGLLVPDAEHVPRLGAVGHAIEVEEGRPSGEGVLHDQAALSGQERGQAGGALVPWPASWPPSQAAPESVSSKRARVGARILRCTW
jgi:hypothetical protein